MFKRQQPLVFLALFVGHLQLKICYIPKIWRKWDHFYNRNHNAKRSLVLFHKFDKHSNNIFPVKFTYNWVKLLLSARDLLRLDNKARQAERCKHSKAMTTLMGMDTAWTPPNQLEQQLNSTKNNKFFCLLKRKL